MAAANALFTACCGAGIVSVTINGTTWRECEKCGRVVG